MFFDYLVEKRRVLRAIHGGPECLVKFTNKDEVVFVRETHAQALEHSHDLGQTGGSDCDTVGTANGTIKINQSRIMQTQGAGGMGVGTSQGMGAPMIPSIGMASVHP